MSNRSARKTIILLIKRDGPHCAYCRVETVLAKGPNDRRLNTATRDHVTPLSRGGTDALSNQVVACWACNNINGDGPAPIGDRSKLTRGRPEPLPVEHSKYILKHGKKAYRNWLEAKAPKFVLRGGYLIERS